MRMDKQLIAEKTAKYVRDVMNHEPGHDWFHIERVVSIAKVIGRREGADMFVVEMAALLHDVDDWKFTDGSTMARDWMRSVGVGDDAAKIMDIIENLSFKGTTHDDSMTTIEGKVVQDADRLDAIGAIGIARVFTFAGHSNNPIHDPSIKPRLDMTTEEYKKNKSTAINHFHEKVLLLKGRMNTATGRELAHGRHEFIEKYLDQFFKEWEGKV